MRSYAISCILLCATFTKHHHDHLFRDQELNPEYGFRALKVIQYLCPMDVVGKEDLVRVGHWTDGGYSMLDDFANISQAYSFGIGGDWSWDSDISTKGINVSMFDHTINPPVLNDPHLKFYKYGISYKDEPDKNLLSLESILKRDNNSEQTNMILKIDAEGAEWEVFSRSSILDKFSQITVELHGFKRIMNKEIFEIMLSALENLNRTHQVVWIHGITAPWIPATNINLGGVPLPDQMEATYVKRKVGVNFTYYNNKKKRVDVRNYPQDRSGMPVTETLIWWMESGNNIDFEGLFKLYGGMIARSPESKMIEVKKNETESCK